MEEVKTLKAEREVIETTLRDPIADISEWALIRTRLYCCAKLHSISQQLSVPFLSSEIFH